MIHINKWFTHIRILYVSLYIARILIAIICTFFSTARLFSLIHFLFRFFYVCVFLFEKKIQFHIREYINIFSLYIYARIYGYELIFCFFCSFNSSVENDFSLSVSGFLFRILIILYNNINIDFFFKLVYMETNCGNLSERTRCECANYENDRTNEWFKWNKREREELIKKRSMKLESINIIATINKFIYINIYM